MWQEKLKYFHTVQYQQTKISIRLPRSVPKLQIVGNTGSITLHSNYQWVTMKCKEEEVQGLPFSGLWAFRKKALCQTYYKQKMAFLFWGGSGVLFKFWTFKVRWKLDGRELCWKISVFFYSFLLYWLCQRKIKCKLLWIIRFTSMFCNFLHARSIWIWKKIR